MTAAAHISPIPLRAPAWSPDEDEILRTNYQKLGAEKTAKLIGRTLSATHHRARRLKIFTHARWTAADDRKLSFLWGEIGVAAVAKALNRTEDAVYFRAQEIGLRRGLQPGMEYVRNAAHRTGFSPQTLWIIFEWHGVETRRTMSRSTPRAAYRWREVDPDDVDEAVAAWMKSETVHDAAGRRGMSDGALVRLLEASGLEMPPKPAKKFRWRIPTETIDKAVALKESRENLFEAAARVGVSRGVLAKLLEAAGVKRYIGKCWLVDKATVDRVVAEARETRPKLRKCVEERT